MEKNKIGKNDFARRVAQDTGYSIKDVAAVLSAAGDTLTAVLEEGSEAAALGGVFYPKRRAERQGVQPGTAERVTYPASTTVGFRPGEALKRALKDHD